MSVDFPTNALTTFDELLSIPIIPELQVDALYGLNPNNTIQSATTSGYCVFSGGMYSLNTQANNGSFAAITSYRFIRYRPGQGLVSRLTAAFTSGAINVIQRVGISNANCGYQFGYDESNARFGIRHFYGGANHCVTLTINTAPNTSQNATITLNSVAYTVALVSESANACAARIASQSFAGWRQEQVDNKVIFLASNAPVLKGPLNGTYSFTSSQAAGSFITNYVGSFGTSVWTYYPADPNNRQNNEWNGILPTDFDPTNLNVYEFKMRWLGAGIVRFNMEDPLTGHMINVHTQHWSSKNNFPHVDLPSFRLSYLTSTLSGAIKGATIRGASMMGAIEGYKVPYTFSKSTYSSVAGNRAQDTIWHLVSIKNPLTKNGNLNTATIFLEDATVSFQGNDPVIIYILFNASFNTAPVWTSLNNATAFQSTTTSSLDLTNQTPLASFVLPANGTQQFDLAPYNANIPPNTTITIAFSSSSSVTRTACALVWNEE